MPFNVAINSAKGQLVKAKNSDGKRVKYTLQIRDSQGQIVQWSSVYHITWNSFSQGIMHDWSGD